MSGLALIVRRSLRQHALSTLITVISVALASGLVMSVFSIKTQTHDAFTGGNVGFDAVLGARGSQMQLVLNTVFHLETSPGNIPWALYKDLSNREKYPQVKLAIPYALGDNYFGFRIVGTELDIFEKYEYQEGKKLAFQGKGRPFDVNRREAVIGSFAAQKTGLKINDVFNPYHGLYFDPNTKHQEEYVVVGILEPSNSPIDRVIWIPLEGIYRMKGHVLGSDGKDFSGGGTIPDEYKEISAVMLKFTSPEAGFLMSGKVNRQGTTATMAYPVAQVMADLFNKIGWVEQVLSLVAYLVVVVAAGSILASIYNTMNERRREFAILRSLGARKSTVFSAIVLEAATIAALGSALGFVFYFAVLFVASRVIREQTGVVLDLTQYHEIMVRMPLIMIVLGALAGVVPAFKAYRTDVASGLVPAS